MGAEPVQWPGGGPGVAAASTGTARQLLPSQCRTNEPKFSSGCVSLLSHCRLSFRAVSVVIVCMCAYRHEPANTVGGPGETV